MTRGIIFASSDMTEGLEPLYVYPSTLDETLVHQIAIKAATLVMTTVDLSIDFEGASLFQFPDKGITILVYYFLFSIEDNEIEHLTPATISLIIESEYDWFLFKEIQPLVRRISRIVRRIAGRKKSYGEFVLKKLSKPVLLIVLFIGVYSALRSLTILKIYYEWIDGGIFVIVTLLSAVLISNIITIITLGYLKVKRGCT